MLRFHVIDSKSSRGPWGPWNWALVDPCPPAPSPSTFLSHQPWAILHTCSSLSGTRFLHVLWLGPLTVGSQLSCHSTRQQLGLRSPSPGAGCPISVLFVCSTCHWGKLAYLSLYPRISHLSPMLPDCDLMGAFPSSFPPAPWAPRSNRGQGPHVWGSS